MPDLFFGLSAGPLFYRASEARGLYIPLTMPIHPSHISLTELRYFIALAEIGHFGRAAAHCNVSQPTLSAGLKKLEESLGVQLFERGHRLLGMTEEGKRLLLRARRVLAEAEELVEEAMVAGDRMRGSLRLGAIPTIAPDLLPWLVPWLDREEEQLRVIWQEERTADLLLGLQEFRLDAAFLALPLEADGLECLPLYEEQFRLVMAESFQPPFQAPPSKEQLQGQPILLLTEGHCLRDQVLELCGNQPREGEAADYRAASLETLMQLVRTGRGMTLLPALAAERSAGLKELAFDGPAPGRRIALCWRSTSPRRAAFRRLGERLREAHPKVPGMSTLSE